MFKKNLVSVRALAAILMQLFCTVIFAVIFIWKRLIIIGFIRKNSAVQF